MCDAGWLSKMRYIFIKRTTLCFNLSNRTHTSRGIPTHTHSDTCRHTHAHSDRLWFRSRHGLQISVPQRTLHGILHCFGQFAFTVINLNAPTPIALAPRIFAPITCLGFINISLKLPSRNFKSNCP